MRQLVDIKSSIESLSNMSESDRQKGILYQSKIDRVRDLQSLSISLDNKYLELIDTTNDITCNNKYTLLQVFHRLSVNNLVKVINMVDEFNN